jgi:protein TonB
MSLAKVLVVSGAAHLAVLGGIVVLQPPEHKSTESIGVMVQQKKKKPKKEEEEKPKPIEAPPEVLHQKPLFKAPPKAAPEPPPEPAAQQHAALNAMPDFGISMTGVGGPGGIGVGVPVGPGGGNPGVSKLTAAPPKEKTFGTVKEAMQVDSPCTEEPLKPKPLGFAQPQYTDDARSAEVEGRVKLKLTVDAQGNVANVQVLAGLGHGLDESSIATAKRIKFTPGTACSKPVGSSFVITFRFALGE